MSFADKIQQNKTLAVALGGLAVAAGAAFYFYKQCSSCHEKKECPMSGKKAKAVIKTVYEKLGGKANVNTAVAKFYDKVLQDNRVKHFFKNTDMQHQIKQQTDFMCMAFGGPKDYVGKNMKDGHKGMNINDEQYNAIVELLAATLAEMGVPADVIGEVAAICEPLRKDICYQ